MNQRHTDAIEEIDKIISDGGPPGYQIYKIVHILRAMEEKIQEDLENMHQELHIGDAVEVTNAPKDNCVLINGARGVIIDEHWTENGMLYAIRLFRLPSPTKIWSYRTYLKKICPVIAKLDPPQYDENF
jgi:hypothetical protein